MFQPKDTDWLNVYKNKTHLYAKEYSNYPTVALTSHASKVMLKILHASMWTMKFQMFKLVLEKAEEPEIKLPTSAGS